MTSIAQVAALIGRASVLPDNCIVNRLAGGLVPNNCGFTLVGDANCGNLIHRDAPGPQSVLTGGKRCIPKIERVMFDPARVREMLRELLLFAGHDTHHAIKHHRTR